MDKQTIYERMKNDDQWLVKGLLTIYANQTFAEQRQARTKELNGIGFNGPDSPFLSSLATQVRNGYRLSVKQMAWARVLMLKYSAQLERLWHTQSTN